MTSEEVERAIGFLLKSQAALTARVATLAATVGELSVDVKALTEVATTGLELASRTAETVDLLATAQVKATEQLTHLAVLVEHHVSTGHGGSPA